MCFAAEDNFSLPQLNYMDPNLNIDIPIFAIHGNHDDPAGDGAFSAMDLLAQVSACECAFVLKRYLSSLSALDTSRFALTQVGLVNYFGKHVQVDDLHVAPVLLRKGRTVMALYGLGNVRDERLYRAFVEKRVNMLQPTITGVRKALLSCSYFHFCFRLCFLGIRFGSKSWFPDR